MKNKGVINQLRDMLHDLYSTVDPKVLTVIGVLGVTVTKLMLNDR